MFSIFKALFPQNWSLYEFDSHICGLLVSLDRIPDYSIEVINSIGRVFRLQRKS